MILLLLHGPQVGNPCTTQYFTIVTFIVHHGYSTTLISWTSAALTRSMWDNIEPHHCLFSMPFSSLVGLVDVAVHDGLWWFSRFYPVMTLRNVTKIQLYYFAMLNYSHVFIFYVHYHSEQERKQCFEKVWSDINGLVNSLDYSMDILLDCPLMRGKEAEEWA